MSFLKFGGFVAGILGAKSSYIPQSNNYNQTAANFDSINRTIDRIGQKADRISFHQQNIANIHRLLNRIERMEAQMQTEEFRHLAREIPGTQRKMFQQIEDLRHEARLLYANRHL